MNDMLVVGFWVLALLIVVFLAWFFAKGTGRVFIDSVLQSRKKKDP